MSIGRRRRGSKLCNPRLLVFFSEARAGSRARIGLGPHRWRTQRPSTREPTTHRFSPFLTPVFLTISVFGVVHNGIIENFRGLRRELTRHRLRIGDAGRQRGRRPSSDAHLKPGAPARRKPWHAHRDRPGKGGLSAGSWFLLPARHDLLICARTRQPAGDRLRSRARVHRARTRWHGAIEHAGIHLHRMRGGLWGDLTSHEGHDLRSRQPKRFEARGADETALSGAPDWQGQFNVFTFMKEGRSSRSHRFFLLVIGDPSAGMIIRCDRTVASARNCRGD